MNLGVIVQARISSTRLPGKIVLPFHKEFTILDIILKKIVQIFNGNIILATSTDSANDVLQPIVEKYGVKIYRGSEHDVLSRFVEVCEQNQLTHALRICADNPFLDKEGIQALIHEWDKNKDMDYTSYFFEDKPAILTHWGLWGEIVSLKALRIANETNEPIYHEHVTNFIYTHPTLFSIQKMVAPAYTNQQENIRLTVDTKEDFSLAQRLFDWEIDTEELIEKIKKEKEILDKMASNIKSNTK